MNELPMYGCRVLDPRERQQIYKAQLPDELDEDLLRRQARGVELKRKLAERWRGVPKHRSLVVIEAQDFYPPDPSEAITNYANIRGE